MGNRLLLTPEKQEHIIKVLKAGVPLETAAAYSNISPATLFNWLSSGREVQARLDEEEAPELTENEVKYLEFLEAVTRARAEIETLAMGTIIQAGTKGLSYSTKYTNKDGDVIEYETMVAPDARHLEWFLERSFWQTYGRRNAIELTGPEGGPIQIQSPEIPVDKEAFAALREAFAESSLPMPIIEDLGEIEDAEIVNEVKEA